MKKVDYSLYLVADLDFIKQNELQDTIKRAIKGGVSVIQLRGKNSSIEEIEQALHAIQGICKDYSVPLIINDNIELALKADADGVHLGQSDMSVSEARKILGRDKIIGVSANTVEEAFEAEKNGASYLGAGAVFSTQTKSNTRALTIERLGEITRAVKIPVVAIGGVKLSLLHKLKGTGISGVAVVSAILLEDDVELAAKTLLSELKSNVMEG